MAVAAYCRNAKVRATPTISSGTVETGYSITALTDEKPDVVVRTTDKVNIVFQIDLGAVYDVDFIAVVNHNFSGGTLQYYSFSAATYSLATIRGTEIIASSPDHHPVVFDVITAPVTTARYWVVNMTWSNASITSADAYFQVGQIVIGNYTTFTNNPKTIPETAEHIMTVHEMKNGASRRVLRGVRGRRLILRWENISSTALDEIVGLYKDTMATVEGWVFMPIYSSTDNRRAYYGHFDGPLEIVSHGEDYYSVSVRFIEEGLG